MLTSAEIQLIRNADPGAILPGIDTKTGNLLPASSLINLSQITQNPSAPYYYDSSRNAVVVTQAGAVLSGINFGSATLLIGVNNVTVKNCTFTATTGYYAIQQTASGSGAVVQNCTFQGSGLPTESNVWISSLHAITIKNNSFLESPTDAIDFQGGVVTGNYFSGSGYMPGAHADAIWLTNSTTPTVISGNLIDETLTPGEAVGPNSDIRITTEVGPVNNVTVSGNYLLGGTYSVELTGGSNVQNASVTNNYIGFYVYGEFYPGATSPIAPNTLVGYANSIYSSQALTAYLKSGVSPSNVVAATSATQRISATGSVPTTLLGEGLASQLFGGAGETNFVGGFGSEQIFGGAGANILTYLAMSDGGDVVTNFDPAKDVIDLSRIDANITTSGVQHFTFIGTAAFSGSGPQVRYQLDTAHNQTDVFADLAGDGNNPTPDFKIVLQGLISLTADNFALTPAQSQTALSNGIPLTAAKVQTATGAPSEYAYTNVKGKSYTSYELFYGSGYENIAAEDLNLSSTSDQLALFNSGLTIRRGSGAVSIAIGTGLADSFAFHATETIDASRVGSENFIFTSGFGSETILGFQASGTTADTISLPASAFSYLTPGMTQAQELAAVLAHATSGPSGLTITDSQGDKLLLSGVTATTIAANPSAIQFT